MQPFPPHKTISEKEKLFDLAPIISCFNTYPFLPIDAVILLFLINDLEITYS